MAIRFVISLVCAILVAIFALQNSGSVDVSFLFVKFSISEALVILCSTIIGAIIVMILAAVSQIKLNLKIRNSSKTIARLQEENKLLNEKVDLFTKEPTGENDSSGSCGEFTSAN